VLVGLPFVPMNAFKFPTGNPEGHEIYRMLKTTLDPRNTLDEPVEDDEAGALGEMRAKAIVAYREARGLDQVDFNYESFSTGDYNEVRGWELVPPTARRGTGFMAVGELANVRAADPDDDPDADDPEDYRKYRIDSGSLYAGVNSGYLKAIAVLACLGDWVTVRSHVFTIYGVLRGQEDETIVHPDVDLQTQLRAADVDSRALRFQETLDRLPTFLGEPAPIRVGDRTVGKYRDTLND
ncbi:MAG: hypothetical protein JSW71_07630, partial [Gemmatimonadota bacterium]